MRIYALAGLLGCAAILLLTTLPALKFLFILLFLLIIPYSIYRKRLILFLLIICLSFTYAVWVAQQRIEARIPHALEAQKLLVKGTIVSLVTHDSIHDSFILRITAIADETIAPKMIKMSWYGAPPALNPGEEWQLQVKLRRIHGLANPGGFDYEAYALENNLAGTGDVIHSAANQRLHPHPYRADLNRLRQYFQQQIESALAQSPYSGMILALVIGEKNNIQPEQWQVLQRTGTNHLFVIAGLHIGLLTGLVYSIVNFLWRRTKLVLWRPAQDAAAIAAIVIAIGYAALAGFSIPTQRALIMIMVFMLAFVWRRNLSLGIGLSLAFIIVLIINPLATLSVAFWLSFAAVSFIFFGFSARFHPGGLWWKYGRMQWVISVGVIPFTLLMFQNASFISPIANALVIPVVGFIVVPLSLLASVLSLFSSFAASLLFHLATAVLNVVWHILTFFASFPLLSWQHAVPAIWTFFAAVLGFLLLLAPRGLPLRWLGVIYCLPLILCHVPTPLSGTAKFTLLDVGQGLASVVQTEHHVLIFDTGAKFGANFDMGASVVIPFLRASGINKIDMLVVSHGDNDHIGGAQSILAVYPSQQILTSVPDRFPNNQASLCLAGEHWQWDGVSFEFLYPTTSQLGLDNNSSCVLHISAGNKSVLLTGDIEASAETYLLATQKAALSATVLIAPHHGSKTSSTWNFIQAVKPNYVLYPVGYLNRYHFPNTIITQRYHDAKVSQWRSDTTGAITFTLDGKTPVKMEAYRFSNPRFWRQDP
jgi:competence protein ComEC